MPDLTFQNNVPDPLVAGKELPQFTFALEKSRGKVMGASYYAFAGTSAGQWRVLRQVPVGG